MWKGTGSLLGRAAGELVPLLLGVVVGSLAAPLAGPWVGAGVGLAAWGVASAGLVRLRRSRRRRWVYRVALGLYALFAVAQGLTHSVPAPARAPVPADRAAWAAGLAFRAGFGEAAFDLPPETTLAGWGAPPRRRNWPAFGGLGPIGRLSLASMGAPRAGAPPRRPMFREPDSDGEVLGARALVILPDGEGPAVALVRLDTITMDPTLADEIRLAVRGVRLDPATCIVAATHTHSGPGGFHARPLAAVAGTDHFDVRVRDALRRAAVDAIEAAALGARPARIAPVLARDRGSDGRPVLARNRFSDAQPIDDRVLGLRFDDAASGRLLGVLLNYGVQPVILRIRHTAFGRDVPGALEDALQASLPGRPPVLFLNAAMGDVSPLGTYGSGAEAARRLADGLVQCIRDDVLSAGAASHLRVKAQRVTWDAGSPHAVVAVGDRASFVERVVPTAWGRDLPSCLANLVALPANTVLWSLGLSDLRLGFTFEGAAGLVLDLDDMAGRRERHCGALLLEMPDRPGGPARSLLLWQGGIPTQAVGRAWRRRVEARGLPTPLLVSLANDGTGYLTNEEEYDRSSYEARATLLGRGGAAGMGDALDLAVRMLLEAAPTSAPGPGGG